ncbi:MAG: hypothetical protein ACI8YI_002495 [Paracoccaceae bacterium]|jgi:hypothetical protein
MSPPEFRFLVCADAGFFHFLPSLEKNIFDHQGAYPVIYDIGMTKDQIAQLKSEVIKITPPEGYKRTSASGAIKTTHKPRCIKHFLKHSDQDVLYVDADVVVLEPIEHDDFLGGDIAVTPRHPKEMLSKKPYLNGTLNAGVIFFRNTPDVISFIDVWESECGIDDKSDQMALSDVVQDADIKGGIGIGRAHGVDVLKLPAVRFNDVSCSIGKLWHFKNAGRRSSKKNKRALAIFVSNQAPWAMTWWLARKRRTSMWINPAN